MSATEGLLLSVAWFENAAPVGQPAHGDPERTTWSNFVSIFEWRREGGKDGCGFAAARFRLEPDGRHIRRLKENLLARTAIVLDVEACKATGGVPPSPDEVADRVKALGYAALIYTTHSHVAISNIRFRVVLPLEREIDHELPALEVIADLLNLAGVIDRSKLGASSLFYLPSAPEGTLGFHQTLVIPGAPIAVDWITNAAMALLEARQAEADHIAALAQTDAAKRRATKIAAGFDPDDSLIEKIRAHFDLDHVLMSHGYDKSGTKYRHPNSSSGSYGADIKTLGGVKRVFSHNAADPLHGDNLPDWCGGVTAIDVVDTVIILDFGGDRTRALRELAERFNLTRFAGRKAMAGLLFRLLRQQAPQEAIETTAFAEGARLGLSHDEVCRVATWVASRAVALRDAA